MQELAPCHQGREKRSNGCRHDAVALVGGLGLEQRHLERKVAALARYASQQHRRYANPEYVWNLARVHGINVNREYAECFQVYRIVA